MSSLRGFNWSFWRPPPPVGGQTFRFPSFLFLGLAWLASHSKPWAFAKLFVLQVIQTGCAYGASSFCLAAEASRITACATASAPDDLRNAMSVRG